jgi:hypothetical protein
VTHSTLGRPRKLTDEQVSAIMQWFGKPRSGRQKMQVLSLELGVPMSTIQYCTEIRGRYKKAQPELDARGR